MDEILNPRILEQLKLTAQKTNQEKTIIDVAGADGLLIEAHNDPEKALCDGEQSLNPETFRKLMIELGPVARAVGRNLSEHVSKKSEYINNII